MARLFQRGSTYLYPHQQRISAYILAKTRFVCFDHGLRKEEAVPIMFLCI